MGMTIEEAIKEIKDASDREVRYGDVKNHYYEIMMRVEAFVMAINVLEERLEIHDNCKKCIEFSNFEPQPCEDCISRETVMKCFKKWQPYMATRLWDYEQELRDLPSVTPSYNSIKTELKPYEDYLKKRDKDYVHYNVKWLLDNWEQELELLSGGKIKPCEDCISRAQALHACCDEWNKDYKAIMKSVRQLPLVKPQRPKAKIILAGNNPNFSPFDNSNKDILKCSNCLNEVLDSFMYCPMCGAEMEIENEKETC